MRPLIQGKSAISSILIPVLASVILAGCSSGSNNEPASPTLIIASTQTQEAPQAAEATQTTPTSQEDPTQEEHSGGVFVIIPNESESRFIIEEVLFGSPNTVVGTTNSITGEVSVNLEAPNQSQVSIQIDLSTFITDNNRRNNTIQNNIFETDEEGNQFALFTAASMQGLPDVINIGETYEFQIIGNLSLHGSTHEVVFEARVTLVSEKRLEGSAEAATDYNLFLSVLRLPPSVASLEDNVILQLDFAAELP